MNLRSTGGGANACRPLAPIAPGEAVITAGYGLPNPHIIHVLGTVYGLDEPSDELLASGYRESLVLAERHGLTSIGLSAISTGAFGYPSEEAARVAVRIFAAMAPTLEHVRLIRMVLFRPHDREVHEAAFREHLGPF